MGKVEFPPEILDVFDRFHTCKLTTLGRDSTPATWPVVFLYQPEAGSFLLTTSIGLPQKAFNIRRDAHVSLLFSEPTGSGLMDPPTVLVQGDASCPDEVVTHFVPYRDYLRRLYHLQPFGKAYGRDPLTRFLLDFYYMRLMVTVVPRRIHWWAGSDLTQRPEVVEVPDAG